MADPARFRGGAAGGGFAALDGCDRRHGGNGVRERSRRPGERFENCRSIGEAVARLSRMRSAAAMADASSSQGCRVAGRARARSRKERGSLAIIGERGRNTVNGARATSRKVVVGADGLTCERDGAGCRNSLEAISGRNGAVEASTLARLRRDVVEVIGWTRSCAGVRGRGRDGDGDVGPETRARSRGSEVRADAGADAVRRGLAIRYVRGGVGGRVLADSGLRADSDERAVEDRLRAATDGVGGGDGGCTDAGVRSGDVSVTGEERTRRFAAASEGRSGQSGGIAEAPGRGAESGELGAGLGALIGTGAEAAGVGDEGDGGLADAASYGDGALVKFGVSLAVAATASVVGTSVGVCVGEASRGHDALSNIDHASFTPLRLPWHT